MKVVPANTLISFNFTSFHWYILLKFMSEEEWLSIGNTQVINNHTAQTLHKQNDNILYGHNMKRVLRASIQVQ